MKTKHMHTNYEMILPFIQAADENDGHKKIVNGSYMPLTIENLCYNDYKGNPVYSITHYGEMNGDLMSDPDMTVSIDKENRSVRPLTFQNDYMRIYQQVFIERDGKTLYSRRLLVDLDEFLWQWLKNIQAQGFNPNA